MARQARGQSMDPAKVQVFHTIQRCVRRAFLCGEDQYSGQSFEHRRQWMIDRIRFLTAVFSIEVCAYTIMSNHYHLVLYINETEINNCSNEEICERWGKIYSLPDIVVSWQKRELGSECLIKTVLSLITDWRERLSNISWFMRCLNEFIARKANKEDSCKGRFWEGRFKSQALLDEKALLTCMVYVDLNPIRAKVNSSVEQSEYTSIFERIHSKSHYAESNIYTPGKPLMEFIGSESKKDSSGICFLYLDYLELVDWSGRIIQEEKAGAIATNTPSLLNVLGLDNKTWLSLATGFGKNYHSAVGSSEELALFAKHTGKKWISRKRELEHIYH